MKHGKLSIPVCCTGSGTDDCPECVECGSLKKGTCPYPDRSKGVHPGKGDCLYCQQDDYTMHDCDKTATEVMLEMEQKVGYFSKCKDCIVGVHEQEDEYDDEYIYRESDIKNIKESGNEPDMNLKFHYCPICGTRLGDSLGTNP